MTIIGRKTEKLMENCITGMRLPTIEVSHRKVGMLLPMSSGLHSPNFLEEWIRQEVL
jgi:hypothetical protein